MAWSLEQWLSSPIAELTNSDDVRAAKSILEKNDPELATRALARLLDTRPHLVWKGATRYRKGIRAHLLQLAGKSATLECRFYARVAPKGLTVLGAIHRANNNHELVAKLSKTEEGRDPAVAAAAAIFVAEPSFPDGFDTCFERDDKAHVGMIVLCLIAGGDTLEPLLHRDDLIKPRLMQWIEMATQTGALPVRERLLALAQAQAVDLPSGRWARWLGLSPDAVWEVEIELSVRGARGCHCPSFKIEFGGNQGEDWCFRAYHQDHGTSTCFAGRLLHDESGLGGLGSPEDLPQWLRASQSIFQVCWDYDKPKISTTIPNSKSIIRDWVKSLADQPTVGARQELQSNVPTPANPDQRRR